MRILSPRTGGVEAAIAGMNSSRQTLVLDDDFEQVCQLFLLVSGKTRHEGLIMLVGSHPDSSECALAIRAQMKGIEATITFGWPALHQTALLQLIENADQTTRVHVESLCQILL